MGRSSTKVIYIILYTLAYVFMLGISTIALCFEGTSSSLSQQIIIAIGIFLVSLMLFMGLRSLGIRRAIKIHRYSKTQKKPLKKRKSFFAREILPFFLSVSFIGVVTALFFMFLYFPGDGIGRFPGRALTDGSIHQMFSKGSAVSISVLYGELLKIVCSIFGYTEASIYYLNGALFVLTGVFMYCFVRMMHTKASAIISTLLYGIIPLMHFSMAIADENKLYLFILMLWLTVCTLISRKKHLAQRPSGIIIFILFGLISGSMLALSLSYGIVFVFGHLLFSFQKDGSKWKISKKCILIYSIAFIVAGVAVIFLTGLYYNFAMPRVLPYPEIFSGTTHFDFIFVLFMGLPLYLQKGNSKNVIGFLAILVLLINAAALFEIMPGNGLFSIMLIEVMCTGLGLGMLFSMSYPGMVYEEDEDEDKTLTQEEAEKKLIESLTGIKSKSKADVSNKSDKAEDKDKQKKPEESNKTSSASTNNSATTSSNSNPEPVIKKKNDYLGINTTGYAKSNVSTSSPAKAMVEEKGYAINELNGLGGYDILHLKPDDDYDIK